MKRKPKTAELAQDEDAVRPGPGDISVHSSMDCFSAVCSPSLRSWGGPLWVRAAVKNQAWPCASLTSEVHFQYICWSSKTSKVFFVTYICMAAVNLERDL